jgi:hypothetical protein
LTYTTEKPEKNAVETYMRAYGSYQAGLEAFVSDLERSSLKLETFVRKVNLEGILPVGSLEYFKPDFI